MTAADASPDNPEPALAERIAGLLRDVPDFPKPGILFKDITPLLADGPAFDAVIRGLSTSARGEIDLVAGIEARGFLIAGALARQLGCGLVPVRKAGKLPPPVLSAGYELEYGSAQIEVPAAGADGASGLLTGRRVLLVDDVLATGGTMRAAAGLLAGAGAQMVAMAVIVELAALGGRAVLGDATPLDALLTI